MVRAEDLAKFYEARSGAFQIQSFEIRCCCFFSEDDGARKPLHHEGTIDFAERVIRLPAKKAKFGASSICL